MIQHILLDLDDTLLDFGRAESTAITKTLLKLKVEPTERLLARYHEINDALWHRLEKGDITRRVLLTERFRQLAEEFSLSIDPELTQQYYDEFLSMGCFFIPGAKELLDKLSRRYTLYIASNGNVRAQQKRILNAGISSYFADVFLSELIGADKPSPVFFDACFARMKGAHRDNTVLVGDSLRSDIRGGMNAGLLTVWFNPYHMTLPDGMHTDAEIHSLDELPAALLSL